MSESHSDLSNMLNKVISNPEAMQKIIKLAGEMKGASAGDDDAEGDKAVSAANLIEKADGHNTYSEHDNKDKHKSDEEEENRIKLLIALKPYLNEERREKADMIIRLLKLMRFTDLNELSKLLGQISK
jgi:hypothetical protein